MPLFEYTCADCNHSFEYLVRSASEDTTGLICPACSGKNVKKQFSTFSASVKADPVPAGGCAMPGCDAPMSGGCGGGMCEM